MFDRSKPFYPFVMQCYAALWGIKELAAHGTALPSERSQLTVPTTPNGEADAIIRRLAETPHLELVNPINLAVTHGERFKLDAEFMAKELANNFDYHAPYTLVALRMLLLAAYEISKPWKVENDPLWEFFRHVRNAAAHNGRFRIDAEPKIPARWGTFEIKDTSLDGVPLFKPPNEGLFHLGDAIAFLHDVEVATPTMKAS